MTRLIFCDSETTGLDRKTRLIWDLAYIIRDPGEADVERQFYMDVDLHKADPFALNIGRYWQRHPNPYRSFRSEDDEGVTSRFEVVHAVAQDFKGATLVGAVPSFDEETLAKLLRAHGMRETWHYHLVDVETLAAGRVRLPPPWNFDVLLAEFDLAQNNDRHTAIGDARLVRDLYDKVLAADSKPWWP